MGLASLDEMTEFDLGALPLDRPCAGYRRMSIGDLLMVDLTLAAPAAVGAVAAQVELRVMTLEELLGVVAPHDEEGAARRVSPGRAPSP